MAPERRSRRGRTYRYGRVYEGRNVENVEDTIAGDPVRRVMDSYCPFCATDIRSIGPRRLTRCPNWSLCGKQLPLEENCCPVCTHYTRSGDNFCRLCRTNLHGVVRGRGGLYQQLRRVPSPPLQNSPPRQEEPAASSDDESAENLNNLPVVGRVGGGEQGGFLRVVAIEEAD